MSAPAPTVVLVHGAFADWSSWNGVIERLQAKDVPVVRRRIRCAESPSTPPIVASVLDEIPGRWSPSATRTAVR